MEDNARKQMGKTLDALRANLAKLRGGRASAGMLDNLAVPCYGATMPLSQIASVAAVDAKTLMVSPWDAGNAAAIGKSHSRFRLGIEPRRDRRRHSRVFAAAVGRAAARVGQSYRPRK